VYGQGAGQIDGRDAAELRSSVSLLFDQDAGRGDGRRCVAGLVDDDPRLIFCDVEPVLGSRGDAARQSLAARFA
jgi:hypothetical protein